MRKLAIITICLLLTSNLFGQNSEVEKLVFQGIELHDQGKYSEAIAKYKEALAIDSKSDMANYEIAYSYFLAGQYNNAIKHSNLAINSKSKFQEEAYMVLGNSYDLLGDYKKAVKSYQKGLSKFPNSNLLNYNLALAFYNKREIDQAEKYAILAIKSLPSHASSHLMLSVIMAEKGKRVQAILPAYYFLMLEPNSKRSAIYYDVLLKQLNKGVSRTDASSISINLSPSAMDDEFATAELMISMYAAKQFTDADSTLNEIDLFNENNKSIFNLLETLKKNNKSIWWNLYVKTFYELVQSDNNEAFGYYISQSKYETLSKEWMDANPDKVNKLKNWIQKEKQ